MAGAGAGRRRRWWWWSSWWWERSGGERGRTTTGILLLVVDVVIKHVPIPLGDPDFTIGIILGLGVPYFWFGRGYTRHRLFVHGI